MKDVTPHFVLVPLAAQGHMIPMVDMARLLAERGVRVTLITTPVNAARIRPIIDQVSRSNLPVEFVELRFPCAEFGLPEGSENIDLLSTLEHYKAFFDAMKLLKEPLEALLRSQHRRPDCMIADMCNGWTKDVARRLGIPRLLFHGPSCFYILCAYNMAQHRVYDRVTDEFEPVVVPDVPVEVVTNKAESPGFFNWAGWEDLRDEVVEAESTADGVVINTFYDLEPSFVDCYEKIMQKKVWTVGPLCLYSKDVDSKAARGNKAAVDHRDVTTWLDSKGASSVFYVSFGSLVCTRPMQLIEIGKGLLECADHRSFIWVVKEAEIVPEVEKWLLEEHFAERTKERGLLIKGWAPQTVILSHPAIGGFLTHCGWNSTLEAISAGVPMLTWPHFADQFLNEKLVVDVLKIGRSLDVKVPRTHVTDDSTLLVTKEKLRKAVSELMEGEEGEEMRRRAKALAEKAKKAMEEGGSSYRNMDDMIECMAGRYGEEEKVEDAVKELSNGFSAHVVVT
ncbi:UDP-glycosyltransferase 73C1 [Ananas comosus]|uniref:Glycosyltransferase n=1 Tax=Ananas comosus TaxID=4615 RepID=A0A199W0W3_ANACO|nr:UDP-glycosyltransferase 73C1 [Ananas comosus]